MYLSSAITGYMTYGDTTKSPILENLGTGIFVL